MSEVQCDLLCGYEGTRLYTDLCDRLFGTPAYQLAVAVPKIKSMRRRMFDDAGSYWDPLNHLFHISSQALRMFAERSGLVVQKLRTVTNMGAGTGLLAMILFVELCRFISRCLRYLSISMCCWRWQWLERCPLENGFFSFLNISSKLVGD